MKAVIYEEFCARPNLRNVQDPAPRADGVVVRVLATGLCRSDWHAWMGHDPIVTLPHVPGHELSGVIEAVGRDVRAWKVGDRVTVPFAAGCGTCEVCRAGHLHLCDAQFQPGFTAWGSFAEYVALAYADANCVRVPETVDHATAASLGCRFATAFRAVVDQARVRDGEWVAIHGCGGVGLSAIMIAIAHGARVLAVDIADDKLDFAARLGAEVVLNGARDGNVVERIREVTTGGAHVSLDALGSASTCYNSIMCVRKRGTHVQVGLMLGPDVDPKIPMGRVIADELRILGSHGMPAPDYAAMLAMIESGRLEPQKLIGKMVGLEQSIDELVQMDEFVGTGVTLVDPTTH